MFNKFKIKSNLFICLFILRFVAQCDLKSAAWPDPIRSYINAKTNSLGLLWVFNRLWL